jgi:hypothetical protein
MGTYRLILTPAGRAALASTEDRSATDGRA